MNLNHRLNGYNSKKPESFLLADCVGAMSDRAEASLRMIQSQCDDELMSSALESIVMEIKDIREAVNDYDWAQKSPDN